ncbi:alternative ribosome rescue aminoacyl-tRNA hydrolase ArfB [Maridesulfovibrio bastinii]|uniref:alternative ribosome rescue aminoacyl-tRNA hydrolase ArfB n=1 Tax=Maridesulfovibrio bastinii TaxID=47157 RepID=UPI0004269F36|nr:alternative ribosome rescue aminoacyl-tRNA hydrolase ArfB [Maridesulfovibrio bastinii]
MIIINSTLSIPESEISFSTSRSSGPGGQHVNTASTKVTLIFNVDDSATLSPNQKYRIKSVLSGRINLSGELRLSAEEHRSQYRNRQEVVERFRKMITEAVKPPKKRKKTRIPHGSKLRRLDSKKKKAEKKKNRSRPDY